MTAAQTHFCGKAHQEDYNECNDMERRGVPALTTGYSPELPGVLPWRLEKEGTLSASQTGSADESAFLSGFSVLL